MTKSIIATAVVASLIWACSRPRQTAEQTPTAGIPVVLDTDANNELDDQHALAYMLLNPDVFDIKGVTVNATSSGGNIDDQYTEAVRVMQLCNVLDRYPVKKGANGSFVEISPTMTDSTFDGQEAVDFIIETAHAVPATDTLVLIAVGKLTNVALAIQKDPLLVNRIRLVWLGSNYPQPGEYNQNNDTASVNYLLNVNVPFEMVTVRYREPSGTDAVRITREEVNNKMPGLGPEIGTPIDGRHGGQFQNFGDYSVSLFEHIEYDRDPPSRALYDMAAVAIVKEPRWAKAKSIPAPLLVNDQWIDRPENNRQIIIWEYFDRDAIIQDLFKSLQ
jgi:inosine-uridine nucleoside N-ribohydrolase